MGFLFTELLSGMTHHQASNDTNQGDAVGKLQGLDRHRWWCRWLAVLYSKREHWVKHTVTVVLIGKSLIICLLLLKTHKCMMLF